MGQKFVERKKLREYALDLLRETSIENVMEFVKEYIDEDLYLNLDEKTGKVRISCFVDYDAELENLHEHIEENY